MEKVKRKSIYYKFGMYVVITVLVNLVALKFFFRIDLTENNLYSLSRASKQAVATLREPLTINVFFSKNLPPPYNTIESYLHDLLEAYALHANEYLNYRFFDVTAKEGDLSEKAEENRRKAQDYGIYPINVQRIEQDEAKLQRAYMGMVFIHGDIIEKIPAVTSTQRLEYKITSTIQKMNNKISALLNLDEKIKINLVKSSSLDKVAKEVGLEDLDDIAHRMNDIVSELNTKLYAQLTFKSIDPSVDQISEEEMKNYERFLLQWPEIEGAEGQIIEADQGLVAVGVEYKDRSMERNLLDRSLNLTSRGLQESFSLIDDETIKTFVEENVDNVINIHEEVGYLTSHSTLNLSHSLSPQFQGMQAEQGSLNNFNSLLSDNYTINRIDLKNEDIPENINTLIIAGPREEFSDWELFQIDQFLMKGKSLALFIDSFDELQQGQSQMSGMRQPVYMPINTRLGNLLDHYGLQAEKAYVLDKKCYVSRDQRMGETPIYFAPVIKNENINHKFDFLKNIKEIIMIQVSPLSFDSTKIKDKEINLNTLISSSKQSWTMSGQINLSPMTLRPPADEEEMESFPLAYLAEGNFISYFSDKEIPERPKEEPENEEEGSEGENKQIVEKETEETQFRSEQGLIKTGRTGKVFLIGSAEILKDNLFDENGESPNAQFVLNTIDYLNHREETAVMRSKNQRFNPLRDTKPITHSFIKIVNIGGLPALLILVGIFIWIRRKGRKKMIKTIFAKQK
ncbi:MAG: Gldg family protein [Acidobacteriota bacterium]